MGLETFGFINDLVSTNPIGASDLKSQGDDHIRGIKSTLKATFPNATAAFYFPSTAAKTTAYSVAAADQNKIILCDATSAAFTVTLGAAATLGSRFRVTIIKVDSSANAITIDADSAETIDGAATRALSRQYEAVTLVCNGSSWYSEGLSLGTTSGPGLLEVATTTEALTGTSAALAVSPDALAALWEKGSDIASSGTISIGEGGFFHITGTTTITDIDFATAKNGRGVWLEFDAALTLTHNATTLNLPGGANITTAAGDRCFVVQDNSDNVHVLVYERASGLALPAALASTTEVLTGTDTTKAVTSDSLAALWEFNGTAIPVASAIVLGEGGGFTVTGPGTCSGVTFATVRNGRRALIYITGGSVTWTETANFTVVGGTLVSAPGDLVEVVQTSSTIVRLTPYHSSTGALPDGTQASTTEVLTGTATDKAVSPDALAALWEKGANEASAGTVSFGEGGFFHITGTTTITDIDWDTAKNGRMAWVVFDGALTLTHNGTTLVLPGGANITTAAGDRALFVQDSSDNVYCLAYIKASDVPLIRDEGTYTPTLTNTTNLDSSTSNTCYYYRIGNRVTVFGHIDVDCTTAAGTATDLGVSLPVASNIGSFRHLAGSGIISFDYTNVRVNGDLTNDRAQMTWLAASASARGLGFHFSYLVI